MPFSSRSARVRADDLLLDRPAGDDPVARVLAAAAGPADAHEAAGLDAAMAAFRESPPAAVVARRRHRGPLVTGLAATTLATKLALAGAAAAAISGIVVTVAAHPDKHPAPVHSSTVSSSVPVRSGSSSVPRRSVPSHSAPHSTPPGHATPSHSASHATPPGQTHDRTTPPGQTHVRTTPPGQTHDRTMPPGQTHVQSTPPGHR